MRPEVTAKTDLPPIPAALADVALLDARSIAASAGGSISSFLDGVRRTAAGELKPGEVPYPLPVIRQPRYTRWQLGAVRAWLIERAAQPHHPEVIARATAASATAQAKRQRRSAQPVRAE
jgi:hypothetical protein